MVENVRKNIREYFLDLQKSEARRGETDRASDVAAVYLFGSVARGVATPRSDIDIGVLFVGRPHLSLIHQGNQFGIDLTRILKEEIDLIVLNDAPADLVHRVLRDGELLVEFSPVERVAFEVQKRSEYFDLLPILEEYRRPQLGSMHHD
jgi:predicted nucleotidyltransferase